jgi:FtsP/CotA-like multicopper oxidase with cupredoxin domain
MHTTPDQFPTETAGLPASRPPNIVDVGDGESFDLRIAPVTKLIGDSTVRMLAYNGSVPGPTLRVAEGSEIVINVENQGDLEATVHWHGLRLENRFDGTHETQRPMKVGESFEYKLQFPDPGVYWYHPHIRQDYGQELGLYGNIIVTPAEPDYWPPAHRELALTLDDILIEDGRVAPFSRAETTYSAMGRFGNQMLVNGDPELSLTAQEGEVVRLYLTNTANTRVFNVAAQGARMKLVGGDSGRCEREQFIDTAVLAPSQRVVVDVLFESAGQATIEHRTPEHVYELASIAVRGAVLDAGPTAEFDTLRTNPELVAERERIAPYRDVAPDKTVAFVAEMDFETPEGSVVYACPMHPAVVRAEEGQCPECGMKLMPTAAALIFACPMHPEVFGATEGKCPDCGMKLMPSQTGLLYRCPMHPAVVRAAEGKCPDCAMKLLPILAAVAYTCPMHPGVLSREQGKCPECGMKLMPGAVVVAGEDANAVESPHADHHDHADEVAEAAGHDHATGAIEWEDDMVEVNRKTTPANTRWKLIDRSTGNDNHAIDWKFRVGDQVKMRLVNEMDSDHPMHHPFHIHGAGRFLVLSRDGVDDPNLVWTDTVLIKTGEVVDILLDVTHPGRWMAHCHIAEHHESGMMFSFDVAPAEPAE